eukprot:jgi/Psemu1/7119/gm1.7119_g
MRKTLLNRTCSRSGVKRHISEGPASGTNKRTLLGGTSRRGDAPLKQTNDNKVVQKTSLAWKKEAAAKFWAPSKPSKPRNAANPATAAITAIIMVSPLHGLYAIQNSTSQPKCYTEVNPGTMCIPTQGINWINP